MDNLSGSLGYIWEYLERRKIDEGEPSACYHDREESEEIVCKNDEREVKMAWM